MGLLRMFCARAYTAQRISFVRHRLKVNRVATTTCPAQMVYFLVFWDFTDKELVSQSMRVIALVVPFRSEAHHPVSVWDNMSSPQPAVGIRLDVNLLS